MKVSIITPAYNQAQFIEETIISVLNQNYPDIEYIILDDGSTDETQEVIKPYLSRLKYIRHDNIGESKTVNKGYRQCSGDIVGVVNSDDPLFTTDAVKKIVSCFQDNPDTLAVYPDWVSIDESGNILNWLEVPQYSIETMLREFNVNLGPGMFIKRTALESIGYRNESLKYTGDLDVSFRLALSGNITHIKGFLATHRVHGEAASSLGRGDVMAGEVVRLSKICLEGQLLPPSLLNEKHRLLGYAYLVSTCYTKTYGLGYFKNIVAALFVDKSLMKDLFIGSEKTRFVKCFGLLSTFYRTMYRFSLDRKRIGGICYRVWLRLPLTFRVRMLRNLEKKWRSCQASIKQRAILRIMKFLGY